MRLGRIIRMRFRSLVRGSRAEQEMQRELDLHLDQLIKQNIADGMSAAEARLAARREFGPLELTREECRDMRRVNLAQESVRDLGYAVRVLAKSPGFTATAVLSLALGIGANTAIFSMVNAFLLRPLPFPHPERLVALYERNIESVARGGNQEAVAPGNFIDWQKGASSFEEISATTIGSATLSVGDSDTESATVCYCSASLITALGVAPLIGRPFRPDEDRAGAPRVVLISYSLWQRKFGGRHDAVDKSIRLDGDDYAVAGVLPREFGFPARNIDVWQPILASLSPETQIRHDLHFLDVIGRLRAGIPIETARAEVDAMAAAYRRANPGVSTGSGANVLPLHGQMVAGTRTPLLVLLAAVGCVLLIACVNIANLMLTRAAARSREIGIRTALGASRGRIIRQLTTESLLIALAGGAGGLLLATSLAGVLAAHAPGSDALLPAGKIPADPTVFLFAFTVALVTGIGIGLFPALRVSRTELVDCLRENTRSATASRAHGRFRNTLVFAEVALSVMLLIASGLFLRSLFLVSRVNPGLRIDRTITLNVTLPASNYQTPVQRSAVLKELGDRVRNIPGVGDAGLVSCQPMTGSCKSLFYYVEGRPYTPGKFLVAADTEVDPAYFAAAGIPLLRGRTFNQRDGIGIDAGHPRLGSIIIGETMAKTVFPGEDPIGKRIFFDFEVERARLHGTPVPRYEIVGVVGDVVTKLDRPVGPELYRPILDVTDLGLTVLLHTPGEPRTAIGAAQEVIRELDRGAAVSGVRTVGELIGDSTTNRRFVTLLFTSFAALALILAVIGLYGLASYAVSQRKAEIGIRMALGATASDISRLTVWQGIKPAFAGVVVGIAGGAFACRTLKSVLFGITPGDPLTFVVAPAVLLAVAALACYVPAARAARIDPADALRAE